MNLFTIDLYNHFGIEKPEGREGILTAYVTTTPPPVAAARLRPAILVIPGGGYSMVSTRESEPVALRFMAGGYAAFVLKYTCAPVTFPVALREACMAMRYIRENAAEFAIDPEMIAAIGFSAGGHLCGTLGTMYDCPEVTDLGSASLLRPNAICLAYPVAVEWGNTHQNTFINISGGDDALRKRLSIDKLVRPDMPPVFLWHTRDDAGVPVRNSLVLAEALDEKGINFAMKIYAHGPHGLSVANAQVYLANEIPYFSKGLETWPEDTMNFFAECGFGEHAL